MSAPARLDPVARFSRDSFEVLALRGVTHRYPGGVTALEDVTLSVRAGELVAIVGPSGAGKTTLLNVVGGLTTPSSGQVVLAGIDLADANDRHRARLRSEHIGFVFQDFLLVDRVPALDAVATGLLYRKLPRRRRRDAARLALERVGLSHRIHHRPHALSGGEKQRVALARALVGGPGLVLADEPTGNLDSDNGAAVVALLRDVTNDGRAVLLITHDAEVAAAADRRLVLRDGRLVSDDTA